jgi:hypothetical protein
MHAERQFTTRVCLIGRIHLLAHPVGLYQKACRCFSASAQQAAGQTGDATANATLGEALTKHLQTDYPQHCKPPRLPGGHQRFRLLTFSSHAAQHYLCCCICGCAFDNCKTLCHACRAVCLSSIRETAHMQTPPSQLLRVRVPGGVRM